MSDMFGGINISGIPSMGFAGGGGGYFGGIPNQQPAMSASQINASMGWNPNAAQFNPFGNTPGGFGGQTSHYAGLGAAHGRATGGFGGYGARNADPFTPVQQPQSQMQRVPVFGGSSFADPTPNVGSGAGDYGMNPFTGELMGGGGGASRDMLAEQIAQPQSQPQQNPFAQMYRMPQANPSYFNPATYAGDQGNYGIPYNGRSQAGDIGFSRQPSYPNIGYNPGMQNWFAPQSRANAYAPLYGAMQFPNSGTPSQYAPGAQMPDGFASPFSADNPGGALPLGWTSPFGN